MDIDLKKNIIRGVILRILGQLFAHFSCNTTRIRAQGTAQDMFFFCFFLF